MWRCLYLLALCLPTLSPISTQGSSLVLSEFLASNEGGLKDEDGDPVDWIEVFNPTTNAVSLLNWSLTDSRGRLDKWSFPSTNLPAGAMLIVFASEKDRRLPGAPLHTNFKLSDNGEYLALVEPDRTTIATEFAPRFPTQFRDVAYGLGMEINTVALVSNGSPSRFRVPLSAVDDLFWPRLDFIDTAWTAAMPPLGFDTGSDPAEDSFAGLLLSSSPLIYYRFGETNGMGVTNLGSLGAVANAVRVGAVAINQVGPQGALFGGFETNNRAYRFGGTARVRIPDRPEFNLGTAAFAVALWFLPTSVDTPADLFSYRGTGGHFSLQLANSSPGTLSVFHNGLIGTATSLTAGAWHHCVVTRDSTGQLELYINGVLAFSAPDEQSLDIDNDLLIGANHSGDVVTLQRPFAGRIDEFALWNRHLDASEILELNLTARSKPTFYTNTIRTDIGNVFHDQGSSVYLRIPFTVEKPDEIDRLVLRLKYDDGVVVYLNGREALALNSPTPLAWDSRATAQNPDRAAIETQEFNLSDLRGVLKSGTNLLALHGLNLRASNPDFLLGVELEAVLLGRIGTSSRYFLTPSPGLLNGLGTKDLGPILSTLDHSPRTPKDADPILVTVRVQPSFAPLAEVTLKYRVNYGVTNRLSMWDDGQHGDGAAADGIYGVAIPASASTNGQCIRYKVEALDSSGRLSRWPLFEDPLGSPEYQGAVIQDAPFNSNLPVWQWWAPTVSGSRSRTREGERVSVYFNGEFFDNVFARERGGATTLGSQKFDFNRGFRCHMSEEVGRVDEANLNGNGSDSTYVRPPLAFDTYRRAGNAACAAFPVLMRLNGRADRVAVYIEQVDPLFVKRFGYNDRGVLYKFAQRSQISPVFSDSTDGVERETFRNEPNTELQQIVDALKLPTAARRQAFFFDQFNIPQFINFLACRSLIMDADDVRKNFYLYLDREGTREWSIFPWDKDWTFGVTGDGGDWLPHPFFGDPAHSKPDTQANLLWQLFFTDPVLREMYVRRLRSVIDQQLQPPWTPSEFLTYEARVDAWSSLLLKDIPSAAAATGELKGFFPRRRQDLYLGYNVLGTTNLSRGVVPDAQPSRFGIAFALMEANPSSGNQAEEFIQFINTNTFAADLSGWRLSGGVKHVFLPGTVLPPGHSLYLSPDVVAFRARTNGPRGGLGLFVQGNYEGQLSAWGEDLVLTDHVGRPVSSVRSPYQPSVAQQTLRISEILFHPELPSVGSLYRQEAFQFIELWNYGSAPVDLTGIKFVDGVSFEFPRTSPRFLASQARVVLVQNRDAFVSRYGNALDIGGVFTGRIDFEGEKLRLEDENGEEIQELTVEAGWQLLADGEGFSLVASETRQGEREQWGTGDFWRASSRLHGSPGAADPERIDLHVVVNEVVSRGGTPASDAIDIRNQGEAAVDVSGWFVSDDPHTPRKYRIPAGTVLGHGGILVLNESQFAGSSALIPFTLRTAGDEAFLYSADAAGNLTGYAHGLRFGATEPGGSIRRWVTSDSKEWARVSPISSLGVEKPEPIRNRVVVGEIHYHPVDLPGGLDNLSDEFLEIRNVTSERLPLFDTADPLTTWAVRGDIRFDFPTNVFLQPQGTVVLVNFDPRTDPTAVANFWARAGLAPAARLLGPYAGKLSNSGGHVRLVKRQQILDSGDADLGRIVEITLDEAAFEQGGRWSSLADGQGASLLRRDLNGFGADPASWIAAAPTPGRQTLDGLPPQVTVQPLDREGLLGSPISLSVAAEGAGPLRFQWEFQGYAIPLATNATLSLLNPVPDQEGEYRALILNGFGAVYSRSAQVRFEVPPIITMQPANQVALLGGRAVFRVSALGRGGLQYQWRRNGVDVSGATTTNLTLNPVSASDFGAYSVVVSDKNASIQSVPVTLTLSTAPVVRAPVQSLSAVLGESIVFSIAVDGPPPLTYRWRRGTTALGTVVPVNANVSFLSITNVRAADLATNYSVVVTNLAGTVSNAFSLTLLADLDRDGMADVWEQQFGLNPSDASDASQDLDQDGRTNREEYLSGTHPRDAMDVLRLEISGVSVQGVPGFRFVLQPQRTYGLEVRSAFGVGSWIKGMEIPAEAVRRDFQFHGAGTGQEGFLYRVVTPRQR